jgi:two-component system OmpR family response regulator
MTPTSKTRILYAEDDPDTRDMVCVALESEGFEVVCPSDPEAFIGLAKEERWDVYMLDAWMPEMSGIELCKKTREFDSRTPIIFYSAAAYERDKQEALECGAQAYVTKPAIYGELVESINQVLSDTKPGS